MPVEAESAFKAFVESAYAKRFRHRSRMADPSLSMAFELLVRPIPPKPKGGRQSQTLHRTGMRRGRLQEMAVQPLESAPSQRFDLNGRTF